MGTGRPFKILNADQLKALMRLKPTIDDTAAFFEVNKRTVDRFIQKEWKITFAEFRDQHMVHTRFSLIRKAIQKAEGGDNVMLVFCLKNLCDWKDKRETTALTKYSAEELLDAAEKQLKETSGANPKGSSIKEDT
jgi:hypothetical protein